MKQKSKDDSQERMPALFVGHGSPMNAIEDNAFSRAWREEGRKLPVPRAILCVSAHWQTEGSRVCDSAVPKTIYDFYGFPEELYEVKYDAPGLPELAEEVASCVRLSLPEARVLPAGDWGLDHGAWSVLLHLFPEAEVPVVQLSLDRGLDPEGHYELGRALRPLRRKGVLVVGSGNIVHNLRMVRFEDFAYDWAEAFDRKVADLVLRGDFGALVDYPALGAEARYAIPTNEHYLPLLYILGLKEEDERFRFFSEKVTYGSLSMRCLVTEEG